MEPYNNTIVCLYTVSDSQPELCQVVNTPIDIKLYSITHIFLFWKRKLLAEHTEKKCPRQDPVHFLDRKMLPLQIAGQVLLQELNPLIMMYYTRGTRRHKQHGRFLGKS